MITFLLSLKLTFFRNPYIPFFLTILPDRHRRELVEAGVLDIALEVLSNGSPDAAAKFTGPRLSLLYPMLTRLGVLWALVEYEQCRELVITSGLVDVLVRRAQELTLPTNTQLLNWGSLHMISCSGAAPFGLLSDSLSLFSCLSASDASSPRCLPTPST